MHFNAARLYLIEDLCQPVDFPYILIVQRTDGWGWQGRSGAGNCSLEINNVRTLGIAMGTCGLHKGTHHASDQGSLAVLDFLLATFDFQCNVIT